MTSTIDVPAIGAMDKRIVIGAGVAVVGFLGWRYYRASSGVEEVAEEPTGYEDGGTIPAVEGATDWYGSGGGSSGGGGTASDGTSTQILTNAQWSSYARDQLLNVDAFSGQSISEALGNYLTGRPLSSEQQRIVRAAIGVAGYPPVGTHPIIPGGDATVTTAPDGLRQTGVSATSVNLQWNPMDGVNSFAVYRSDVSVPVSVSRTGTTATVGGLTPNTSYTFQVAALASSGQPGPKSHAITTKTAAVTLVAPTGVRVTSVTATGALVSWNRSPGAAQYHIYVNGNRLVGSADGSPGSATSYRISGLAKRTTYTLTIRADTNNQAQGPASKGVRFTTKSK